MTAWFETLGIGTYYLRVYALYGGTLAVAGLVTALYGQRLPRWIRTTVWVVMLGVVFRLVLLDNPVALRFYQRHLTPEAVGFRQWGVLELDIKKYARRIAQPELANLAVGSSQVGAIFSHWAGDPTEPLVVFSLAGMKTLDYELYREEIAALNPQRVILYLSAFDLTAGPELSSWPLAPSHPLRTWSVVNRVTHSGAPTDVVAGPSHAYIASQLMPEYRYSFIFRGFLKRVLESRAVKVTRGLWMPALLAAERAEEGGADVSALDSARVREFVSYYLPEWLDYNMGFLRSFIEFCRARGIDIVIVEGQVHPAVMMPKLKALEPIVKSRFAELAMLYSNVRVVETSDTYRFVESDYTDFSHVHPEAARRYTQQLAARLGKAASALTGACDLSFGSGWHAREGGDADWHRWSSGAGRLRIRVRESGTYTLRGELLSITRPNVVEVAAGGQVRGEWAVTDPRFAFHQFEPIRLTVRAGEAMDLTLLSRKPPVTQVTEQRALTFAVKNLMLQGENGKTCAVVP